MSSAPPIYCVFVGEGFTVLPRHLALARQHYGEGEIVPLVRHEERSRKSHDHYFAVVHDAWENLPEDLVASEFPTSEHLRKKALIKAGYRDEHTVVCSSRAEALRVAAFIRPIDDFALVSVQGSTVVRLTAKSQSMRAMGRADFQASKDAVLKVVSDLLAVEPAELERNAREVA